MGLCIPAAAGEGELAAAYFDRHGFDFSLSFFYDGWEKRPERIAEIYDAAGLEGSVIRRPCENRWTDRRPPAQTA